jgi:large subunit ribosomal protein L6
VLVEYSSQNVIKVPADITCYFCRDRNFLYIKGKLKSKVIKLEVKILLENSSIVLINERLTKFNGVRKQGLRIKMKMLIKKSFLDVTRRSYKKLKLVGVGFRVKLLDIKQFKLLKFDVGYSHSVYYKIPKGIEANVTSPTKIIVSGSSSDLVCETSSVIRKIKLPEFYKGKGILYGNEEIQLKTVRKS